MKNYIVVYMFKGLPFHERIRVYDVNNCSEAVQRDEVWLMDKNEFGESSMKHISDFIGIRGYEKLGQKMIEGAFGAMPDIINNTQ